MLCVYQFFAHGFLQNSMGFDCLRKAVLGLVKKIYRLEEKR